MENKKVIFEEEKRREHQREYQREWRKNNRDRINVLHKRYRDKNKEIIKERSE